MADMHNGFTCYLETLNEDNVKRITMLSDDMFVALLQATEYFKEQKASGKWHAELLDNLINILNIHYEHGKRQDEFTSETSSWKELHK